MQKIKHTATLLIPVLVVFAVLYVVFTAGGTLRFGLFDRDAWFDSHWVAAGAPITLGQRLVYLTVWLLPVAFGLYAVYGALRLSLIVRRGVLFDLRISRYWRQIGLGTSASGLTDFIANLVSPKILSWANPGGAEPFRWYFDSEPAGLIVCGGGFYLVGWMMAEAIRLAEENESFV